MLVDLENGLVFLNFSHEHLFLLLVDSLLLDDHILDVLVQFECLPELVQFILLQLRVAEVDRLNLLEYPGKLIDKAYAIVAEAEVAHIQSEATLRLDV